MKIFNSLFENYDNLVFISLNTTGLNPKEDRVIELAAYKLTRRPDGEFGKSRADMFVKLPGEIVLPDEIERITGISDEALKAKGMDEEKVSGIFANAIKAPKTLLIAHNANFHLAFLESMLRRSTKGYAAQLYDCDYLDTLTILKDRKPYPHKLENALESYRIPVKPDTRSAIEKVMETMNLLVAMERERDDIASYINIFGFNDRYGVDQFLRKVDYLPQDFHDSLADPNWTLYALSKLFTLVD